MTRQGLTTLLAGILALALCATLGAEALAQAASGRQPQLMEGKKTLFKRVIVRPGATLYPAAAEQGGAPMPAFSTLYVYGSSGDFVEVGKAVGSADGFVKADKLIDWKQTIVAVFSPNRVNRERSLLFKSPEAIDDVLHDPNPRDRLSRLRADAAAGRPGDGSVVAIEPETPVDIRRSFYFFPILSVAEKRLGRISGQVLHVASLSKIDPQAPAAPVEAKKALGDMRIGIVFVVDTTASMTPYIQRVRDAMTRLETQLDNSPASRNLRFGLVGFRQSLEDNSPGVEYHVKTFLRLGKESTAAAFVREIDKVKESPVPTAGFDEDSLGGIYEALTNSDWHDFDVKFIVLVTDAGPLLPESKMHLQAPGLGPAEIQRKAMEEGIAIVSLHLLTPEGASDHAGARVQYGLLSRTTADPLYFDVADGALQNLTGRLDEIGKRILKRAVEAARGQAAPPSPSGDPVGDAIERNFYAMQLAYLGRREGSRAPDMFEAYLPDRDLSDPTKSATEIRLILTKNQLSTMHDVAKRIVESAERSTMDSTQFFSQLRMAIAGMARTGNALVNRDPQTLGAALGEFLEGLPYASASPVLSIDPQMWVQMGAARQSEIRVQLERKIKFFEEWHNTPENWIALNRGTPDGEKITAFPLSQLP